MDECDGEMLCLSVGARLNQWRPPLPRQRAQLPPQLRSRQFSPGLN